MTALLEELQTACPGLRPQERMARHTSLAVGGPAEYFADVNTPAELMALHALVRRHQLSVFFVGAGSNLLVSDMGIPGLVIHLQGEFRQTDFEGETVFAGAGVWLPALARACAAKGLSGLEALVGVPGCIGGGLVMNAGTREGWLGNVVESVEVLEPSGQTRWMDRNELQFAYRASNLGACWVLRARLRLKPESSASIMARIESLLQYRARTQPLATSNCGSVFKNPEGGAAAQMIEACGLKGASRGGARISERHANFIINEKNATAQDVYELMRRAQQKVFEKFGVKLEPEVKLIGEFPAKEELFR
jgi:UDP-N-acetylmuramate dehydrogenase